MTNIAPDFLRAFNVLEAIYDSTGIDELGVILSNMSINRFDGRPMDELMYDYWEQASKKADGFNTLTEFLKTYASRLTPPTDDFRRFVDEMDDESSATRSRALELWLKN